MPTPETPNDRFTLYDAPCQCACGTAWVGKSVLPPGARPAVLDRKCEACVAAWERARQKTTAKLPPDAPLSVVEGALARMERELRRRDE